MKTKLIIQLFLISVIVTACTFNNPEILLNEDFSTLPHGPLGTDVGAHTEYHYIAEARSQTRWAVSTFRYNLPPSWEIRKHGSGQMLVQNAVNPNKHWHPMVVTGSEFWNNYSVEVTFKPEDLKRRNGLVFRYQNDRQYYFAGIENDSVKIIKDNDGKAFQIPDETVLAADAYNGDSAENIKIRVEIAEDEINCKVNDKLELNAKDGTFKNGKVALLSDSPANFYSVIISTDSNDFEKHKNKVKKVCNYSGFINC